MIKVGIIGCGWAGRKHAESFQQISDTKVVAVSDPNIDAVQALAHRFDIPKVYSNYKELLEKESIDLVDICTPISTHKDIVLYSTEYVHNILLEKPMARTSRECNEIITNCEDKGVNICVCHNRIFFPAVIKIKSMLENMDQGNIVVKVTFELPGASMDHWKSKQEEGGMLWEEVSHAAYILQFLLPDIKEVEAVGSKLRYVVYDNARAFLRCSNNNLGLIDVSWTRGAGCLSLEVFTLQYDPIKVNLDYRERITVNSGNSSQFIKEIFHKLPEHLLSVLLQKMGRRKEKTIKSYHFELINAYVDYILKRTNTIPIPPEQGRAAVLLLEYIQESIEQQKPMSIEERQL